MFQKVIRKPNAREEVMKQNALQTMRSARTMLIDQFPLLGHLSMQLEIIPVLDERLPVAATDGNAVFVNAYVIEHPQKVFKTQYRDGKLKDKFDAALAILAHEVWHCALLHFDRGEGKEHWRFNIAADIEIGHLLMNTVIPNLSAARCFWAEPGMSAEEIYDLLKKPEPRGILHWFGKQIPFFGKSDPAPQAGENSAGSTPESGNESSAGEQPKNKIKAEYADGHYSRNAQPHVKNTQLPNYGNSGIQDPDYTPQTAASPEEAEELRRKWQDALAQKIKRYGLPGHRPGTMPGNLSAMIQADNTKHLDWKQLLRDYVSQVFCGEYQMLPPNRRYVWQGLYLPGRAKQKSIDLVIALDTSGSTVKELPAFLNELQAMAEAFGKYKLTVIQCDTNIRSVNEYSNDDPLPPDGLRFIGRGGTNLCPPFQYAAEKMENAPTVLIYFTDGYGNAPAYAPEYPVIWCLSPGGRKPAPWGIEVEINTEKSK